MGTEERIVLGPRNLVELGWTADRAAAFAPLRRAGFVPGRVVSSGGATVAMVESGSTEVIVQRRQARASSPPDGTPAVGDWLALEPVSQSPPQAALRVILPRAGTFSRSRASDARPQVLAANLDVAFLVSGLDHDLNLRRIERYLVLSMAGEVRPVVVLNKVDIARDLDRAVAAVHAVAPGARVIISSALTGVGVDELRSQLTVGLTACLLGSSGVGKSSLINRLLGEERQVVRSLREDDSKGRHATRRRQLFVLPGGGLVIDTPGLRAVGMTGEAAAIEASFEDISSLAKGCRFSDCAHGSEPGCAVRAAVARGTIPAERVASHHKLEAERRAAELRADTRARREAERRVGRIYHRAGREAERYKRGPA